MNYNTLIEKIVNNVIDNLNEKFINQYSESQKYKIAVYLINKGYLIHCTNTNFSQFNSSFIQGGSRAKEGYGFYFSDMPYKSIQYGDIFKIIEKDKFNFLPLKDKVDLHWFSTDDIDAQISKFNYMLDNARNNREFDYYMSQIQQLKNEKEDLGIDDNLLLYIKDALSNGNNSYGSLEYYIKNPQINIPKLISVYTKHGYDGGYYEGIYTVWNIDKLNQNVIELNDEDIKEIAQSL